MAPGRTDLRVSRLGIGAMVWGDMSTAPWWSPARTAYGPTSLPATTGASEARGLPVGGPPRGGRPSGGYGRIATKRGATGRCAAGRSRGRAHIPGRARTPH